MPMLISFYMEWVKISIVEVADALDSGIDIHDLTYLDGTVFKTKNFSFGNRSDYYAKL